MTISADDLFQIKLEYMSRGKISRNNIAKLMAFVEEVLRENHAADNQKFYNQSQVTQQSGDNKEPINGNKAPIH